MIVEALSRIRPGDESVVEGTAHAALFAHVGVTDLEDWRSVALRLACQYAPELRMGLEPCETAKPTKKGGRPEEWDDWRLTMVEVFVGMVRENSRAGRIRSGLDTNIDACKFIVGTYPETQWMRDALGLKPDTSPATLDNMRRRALKLSSRTTANGNV